VRILVILVAALVAGSATAPSSRIAARVDPLPPRPSRAYPLPPRGPLVQRAHELRGPRAMMDERLLGRSLTMWGNVSARSRVLVAGCANGTRCGGTDAVESAMFGCPPDDAEIWYLPTLDPGGADLDLDPAHAGAAAWRQAAADLRPRLAIVFRTGPRAGVRATGLGERAGRRYARLARLPFAAGGGGGLSAWTQDALPRARAITVTLPPGRPSARRASRLAYAIDRLAGTRFAAPAEQERLYYIHRGRDPRQR
jgi:hypothetical protein